MRVIIFVKCYSVLLNRCNYIKINKVQHWFKYLHIPYIHPVNRITIKFDGKKMVWNVGFKIVVFYVPSKLPLHVCNSTKEKHYFFMRINKHFI
jgi:hypothetical protein